MPASATAKSEVRIETGVSQTGEPHDTFDLIDDILKDDERGWRKKILQLDLAGKIKRWMMPEALRLENPSMFFGCYSYPKYTIT